MNAITWHTTVAVITSVIIYQQYAKPLTHSSHSMTMK